MKLVTIILLLCVHSADSADCEGGKNLLVFCPTGNDLKITISTGETVEWKFNDGELPNGNSVDTTDSSKRVMTLPTLAAEHTGLYTARYSPSMTEKFTIIVGAVTCTKDVTCEVGKGASIKLESGLTGTLSWTFTAATAGATEEAVNEAEKFTTNDKEVLGLFNVTTSGKYKAKLSPDTDEFPVTVSERARVSSVKIESQGGKARVCPSAEVIFECTVTGDVKSYSWTKDNTAVDTNKVTVAAKKLTISSVTPDHAGSYACKALGYFSDALVASSGLALEVQDTQVSNVRITRKGSVLTCEATGAVKNFEWEMEDGTKVSSQHGVVGNVKSQLNLTLKAKGNFVCKAIGCDDKGVKSDVCVVGEDHGDNKANGGLAPPPTTSEGLPGRGPQGASISVALLLISVLVELYVMML
ncbi:uncharacterized protein [Syngnathus scovelli]|uniref:uncharacterized protein n=1 Tax=Syngnathus scovelli TaxID=161590 RepID=UPI00210F8ED9|nr:uncharacterized protein LOC125989181 [Syngnathus scovelli]